MQLDGPIVLCGRSDNDTLRGYNGRLTQLAIFDTSLSPLQVFYIYKQVNLEHTRLVKTRVSMFKVLLMLRMLPKGFRHPVVMFGINLNRVFPQLRLLPWLLEHTTRNQAMHTSCTRTGQRAGWSLPAQVSSCPCDICMCWRDDACMPQLTYDAFTGRRPSSDLLCRGTAAAVPSVPGLRGTVSSGDWRQC